MNNLKINKLLLDLQSDDGQKIQTAIKSFGDLSTELDKNYAFDRLIELLGDSNPWFRLRAVHALGSLGDLRAIKALIDSIEDTDEEIGTEMIEARYDVLSSFKDSRAIEPLISQIHRVDFKQAWDLYAFSDKAVYPMIEALKNDNPYTRWMAAYWLGNLHSEIAIPALEEATNDSNERVRNQAIHSLKGYRNK